MNTRSFPSILLTTVVLSFLAFGLCMLFSTSSALYGTAKFYRQVAYIGFGSFLGLIAYFFDYRVLSKYYRQIFALMALVLLYLVVARACGKLGIPQLPFTKEIKGAYRWISFGRISLQPSEFAKIVIVIFLAQYFHLKKRYSHTFLRGFIIPASLSAIIMGLIFAGKSLSVTALTGGLTIALLFIAGVRIRYLILTLILGVVFVLGVARYSPERLSRLTSFQNPELLSRSDGYQLWNSLMALGSGGIDGTGFANSRMKNSYLPEAHTDFILSIVGEELGYIGILVVILMYILFLLACLLIAHNAIDPRGTMIAAGLGISISLHAFCNIMVISGFGPTTGVTAPFISYGGSSIVAALFSVGMLLNVARVSNQQQESPLIGNQDIQITRL